MDDFGENYVGDNLVREWFLRKVLCFGLTVWMMVTARLSLILVVRRF